MPGSVGGRGLTGIWSDLAVDARIRLHTADVADVLRTGLPDQSAWDLILLDVDNCPDFLIHSANARLYRHHLLDRAVQRLRFHGRLAIWCQGPSADLAAALQRLSPAVEQQTHPVRRGNREFAYAVYVLTGTGGAITNGARVPTDVAPRPQ